MSAESGDVKQPLLNQEAQKTAQSLRRVKTQCVDFTRLEIVRDFVQNISLFFSAIASKGLTLAKKVFGHVFGVVSDISRCIKVSSSQTSTGVFPAGVTEL
eukprot:gb/GECG01016412.1/.p1 GENE.gb/GECG01016412.1/~~gb/GECG01016412.1/.p1  ORF type:complete len:100 (+),score=8.56 gb/GECG01016412.1/:1-300(+)